MKLCDNYLSFIYMKNLEKIADTVGHVKPFLCWQRAMMQVMALTELRVIPALKLTIRRVRSIRYTHKGTKMDEKLFFKEKEKFLKMSQEQRRKRYSRAVLTLDKVSTWSSYYKMNADVLQNMDKTVYVDQFSLATYESMSHLNDIVSIWKGDITKIEVDAIVNAANNSLLGGLGVDGAIHSAAGKFLYNECKILQGCETGDAKITGGYELPAKYVIHTVGPKGENPSLLESCYSTCLKVLLENELRTIAFPCISTGLYGYPQDAAACVALKTVRKFLESNVSSVDRVVFCLFLEKDVEIYEALMQVFFPVE